MMICNHCQKSIPPDSKHCGFCGTAVEHRAPAAKRTMLGMSVVSQNDIEARAKSHAMGRDPHAPKGTLLMGQVVPPQAAQHSSPKQTLLLGETTTNDLAASNTQIAAEDPYQDLLATTTPISNSDIHVREEHKNTSGEAFAETLEAQRASMLNEIQELRQQDARPSFPPDNRAASPIKSTLLLGDTSPTIPEPEPPGEFRAVPSSEPSPQQAPKPPAQMPLPIPQTQRAKAVDASLSGQRKTRKPEKPPAPTPQRKSAPPTEQHPFAHKPNHATAHIRRSHDYDDPNPPSSFRVVRWLIVAALLFTMLAIAGLGAFYFFGLPSNESPPEPSLDSVETPGETPEKSSEKLP